MDSNALYLPDEIKQAESFGKALAQKAESSGIKYHQLLSLLYTEAAGKTKDTAQGYIDGVKAVQAFENVIEKWATPHIRQIEIASKNHDEASASMAKDALQRRNDMPRLNSDQLSTLRRVYLSQEEKQKAEQYELGSMGRRTFLIGSTLTLAASAAGIYATLPKEPVLTDEQKAEENARTNAETSTVHRKNYEQQIKNGQQLSSAKQNIVDAIREEKEALAKLMEAQKVREKAGQPSQGKAMQEYKDYSANYRRSLSAGLWPLAGVGAAGTFMGLVTSLPDFWTDNSYHPTLHKELVEAVDRRGRCMDPLLEQIANWPEQTLPLAKSVRK